MPESHSGDEEISAISENTSDINPLFREQNALNFHDIKGVRVIGLSNARISQVEMYFCNAAM